MIGRTTLAVLALLGCTSSGTAQISPGELSAPHAALEGSANCLGCHSAEKGVDRERCLSCHGALAERIGAGAGLHAAEPYRRCERCHSEHNGRGFELVHWPEGERSFEHSLAGWPLEGRHAHLGCRECHRPDRVASRVKELEPKRDLEQTFLGLSAACTACHSDPHRGSMDGTVAGQPRAASCSDCHSQESWKSPRAFDHDRTRFALDEVHSRVACADCHRQSTPEDAEAPLVLFDQYRGRAGALACADCHRDPHQGRLGPECGRCHTGSSFRSADRRAVDHDRTAYPLRGRHREVACERCHLPGRGLRIARFDRCESCHGDAHLGQLAGAAGGADANGCEACHSIAAWTPALFGAAEHERARFPLAGAHRAVPCSTCHRQVGASELPAPLRRAGAERTRQFRFADIDCADCHRDPHAGELDRWAAADTGGGCRACHDQERWRPAAFDHARTRFALAGAHARAACDGCHPRAEPPSSERRFAGRPIDCGGCHRDVHEGQLARAGITDCARCHTIERFRPAPGFDHGASRFPLDGRHVGVPCGRCHPTEPGATGDLVRYVPRPRDCAGCHATMPRSGDRS